MGVHRQLLREPLQVALCVCLLLLTAPARAGNLVIHTNGPIYQAGYGQEVTLRTTVEGAPDGVPVAVSWRQVGGPDVAASMRGADTAELRFVTRPLLDVVPDPARTGVVAIPASATGDYRFEVTASAGAVSAKGEAVVQSAYASTGTRGIAVGTDVILAGPKDQTDWLWTFEMRGFDGEVGTVVRGADTRFPVVRELIGADLTAREAFSGSEIKLYGGPWSGFEPCSDCHTEEHTRWQGTKHATVLERGLLGALGKDYREECLACHAIGWQPGVDNGGFDDVARRIGWRFPETRGKEAAKLPPELRTLAGVDCLSCHGPGRFTPSRFDAGMCAACHDRPPRYARVAEWASGPMSRFRDPVDETHPATVRPCTRCHSTQGFVRWTRGVAEPDPPFPEDAEPITCAACHDPHDGRKPHQLRVYDATTTLSGVEVSGAGAGAICMRCHNVGEAAKRPLELAPLAPQADVYAGELALGEGLVGLTGAHSTLDGSCTACHLPHAFVAAPACDRRGCSGRECHLGTSAECKVGDPAQMAVDAARLRGLVAERIAGGKVVCKDGTERRPAGVGFERERLVLVDGDGRPLRCSEGAPIGPLELPEGRARRAARAGVILMAIERDGSGGVHNPTWTGNALGRAAALLR